ncbi:hypothetical protein OWV82_010458 [Melia azedarach]|uniref:Uncharacterized protein n=1 Tax=Melia azedarach TaxID=155640 RepID=A0ACC1Y531_MELAZ|nr:hypothetical protein OWV82_010458 [Melia azedarach]
MGSQILQEPTELGMSSQLLPHSLGQEMGIGMCEQTINPQGQGIGSLEELLKEQIMCSLEHLQCQQMTSQQQKIDPVADKKLRAESRASASQEENNKALVVSGGGLRSGDGAVVPYHVPEKRKKAFDCKSLFRSGGNKDVEPYYEYRPWYHH